MSRFISKKVTVEEPDATMIFCPGQFRRPPFRLEEKNIYLVGMWASGKSTVGKEIGRAHV